MVGQTSPNSAISLEIILTSLILVAEAVIYSKTSLAAVVLGASILEKHFTSDKSWPGPDVSISIGPSELKDLIDGSRAIYKALGGKKNILAEEEPTINFAYASVVALRDIKANESFTADNIWVKRPGTGEIRAESFDNIIGKKAKRAIKKDEQIKWEYIYG